MARKQQLNLRLKPEDEAILRAAAFVNDKSPTEFARELIEGAITSYAKLPAVKKAMEARAEQSAESEGKLVRLARDASEG